MMNTSVAKKSILVVKNRAMGDAVISLGALQYARELFPDHHLIYGVPSWTLPLFENVDTVCDEIIPINLKKFGDWKTLWSQLNQYNLEHIFELFQSGRTGKFFKLYSMFSSCDYKFHNHHEGGSPDVKDQGVIKPNIQRDIDGLFTYWGKDYPDHLNYTPWLKPRVEVQKEERIVLGVVATRPTKMWPRQSYVELAKELKAKGLKVIVPISPSQQDQEIKSDLVSKGMSEFAEFIEVPLAQLPLELAKAKYYIGNDTGLKHICVALGLKTMTLFGPEPPLEWHPYKTDQHLYMYREGLECRTRDAHFCGLFDCDSMICLNQISSKDVIENFFR